MVQRCKKIDPQVAIQEYKIEVLFISKILKLILIDKHKYFTNDEHR